MNANELIYFKDEDISLEKPTEESDSWYVSIDDEYLPDYKKFVMDRFNRDYPHIKLDYDWDKFGRLISRTRVLQEWKLLIDSEYSSNVTVPRYYSELVDPEDYKKARNLITEYSRNERDRSDELNEAALAYKKKYDQINSKYDKLSEEITSNDIVFIATLNSNLLPITLQCMIEDYVPADASDSVQKRKYAREILVRYKMSLLKALNEGRNIRDIVSSLQTK